MCLNLKYLGKPCPSQPVPDFPFLTNFPQLSQRTQGLFPVPCPFAMFPNLHTSAHMVLSAWKSRPTLSTTSV